MRRWKKVRELWVGELEPTGLFHRLFDHVPGVYFFAKNREGHLMFASAGLLQRYQMADEFEILGRTDFDLNPDIMAGLRPVLENPATLPGGGAASLAASAACPLLI
jgi:hypothetical protein